MNSVSIDQSWPDLSMVVVEPKEHDERPSGTLGDVLYADKRQTLVSERDWLALVQSIARGDQRALYALYDRTYLIVFTLAELITNDRETAEALTVDVFHEVWRQAPRYDPANGTVVAWVMNQARYTAMGRLRSEQLTKRLDYHSGKPLSKTAEIDPHLKPSAALCARVAHRIAEVTGWLPAIWALRSWVDPEWKEVAPGISCKLLATDTERDRVSMLVRLAPGADYPPHRHAGADELHLLHGELMIDDRKLYPGDYSRAEPGTSDKRVWSETGCMCVLITSTRDELRCT